MYLSIYLCMYVSIYLSMYIHTEHLSSPTRPPPSARSAVPSVASTWKRGRGSVHDLTGRIYKYFTGRIYEYVYVYIYK